VLKCMHCFLMRKINVSILGIRGFLGGAIAERFRSDSRFRVMPAVAGDLTERARCRRAVRGADMVINAAGIVTSRRHQAKHPAEILYNNSLLTLQVFEACRQESVKKVITFSSSTAFPPLGKRLAEAADLARGVPEIKNGVGFYGISRWLVPVVAQAYEIEYGIHSRVLVFPNLYGPGDKFNHAEPPLVANLTRTLWKAARSGEKSFYGGENEKQSIDLLYISDAVDLVERVALQFGNEGCMCITAGSGRMVTIGKVTAAVARAADLGGEIMWKPGAVSKGIQMSNGEAERHWKWKPKTAFVQGIRETMEWFAAHQRT